MSDRFMLKLLAHQLLSVINFWCTRDVARPIHLVQHHTVEKKALSLGHKKLLTVILVVFVLAAVTTSDEEEREEQTNFVNFNVKMPLDAIRQKYQ